MSRFAQQYGRTYPLLGGALVVSFLISAKLGAVHITFEQIVAALRSLFGGSYAALGINAKVFLSIRLPRALLCVLVGAALSVAGVLLQALFRNPIVEPGLIGTSSGAAFGAAVFFVLGSSLSVAVGSWVLPGAAFVGASVATWLVYALSYNGSRHSVTTLLLAGIAVNAVFLSGVGFLSYIARDPQARSITFWNLGTFSTADWRGVVTVGLIFLPCFAFCLRETKALNALMLGEEEVSYLGISVHKLKFRVMLLNVLIVAVATAFVGVISFVGLVVPHLLRIWKGSDNRYLLLGSALLGGVLLSLADLLSRLLLAPAELPIGIVTSFVGAPVFIWLIRKQMHYFEPA